MSKPDTITRRERKKEDTRRAIVNAAMLLFERDGFAVTTMEQIAEAADVAKGTLYNYFPVKEAIISAFMRYCIADVAPELERLLAQQMNTRERLKTMFRGIAEWQKPHRELFEPYVSYRMSGMVEAVRNPELRSGFDRNLAAVLQKGVAAGDIRADLPLAMLIGMLESAYLMVLLKWLVDETCNLEQAFDQMIDMILDGAATGGGR